MIFSKALIFKGLGLMSVAGGGLVTYGYFNNQLTKYDQGLIDYLENGGKIKFVAKDTTTDTNGTELNNSFPTFSTSSDGQPPTAKVSIKVTVNTEGNEENNNGKLTDGSEESKPKGKKENLKRLNGGEGAVDWTWSCELKFIKKARNDSDELDTTQKEKIVNGSSGLFNKLKTEEENDGLKKTFIKNCASTRGAWNNWKISREAKLTENKIETTKIFKLKKDDTSLKFEDNNEFENWFNNPKSSN